MSALRRYIDKIKPNVEKGGKFHMFQSTNIQRSTYPFTGNFYYPSKWVKIVILTLTLIFYCVFRLELHFFKYK